MSRVVVDEIDEAIREIRGVIFTLHRPAGFDSGLETALRASIDEASRLLGHRPTLKLGGILSNISHDLGAELLAVLREAMMQRGQTRARPRGRKCRWMSAAESVVLIVYRRRRRHVARDAADSGGLGVRNIQERASKLGGKR